MNTRGNKPGVGVILLLGIFILVGIGLCIFGFKTKKEMNEKDTYYIETTGVVVNHDVHSGEDGTTYSSVIEYRVNGQSYLLRADMSSGSKEPIGKEHKVMYHPDDYEDAYVKSGLRSYWFIIFMGLFFTAVPIFVLVATYDRKGIVAMLMLPVVFGGLGFGVVAMLAAQAGSWNPFRAPASFVGYVFMAIAFVIAISTFSNIRNLKSDAEEMDTKIWHPGDEGGRKSGNLNGYVVVGEVGPQDIFEADGTPTIFDKATDFYEDNQEEINKVKDIVDDKVMPVVEVVQKGVSIVQKIIICFIASMFMMTGFSFIVIGCLEGWNWQNFFIGLWFVFIPVVILVMVFDTKGIMKGFLKYGFAVMIGFGVCGYCSDVHKSWNPVVNPWMFLGYIVMAAVLGFCAWRIVKDISKRRRYNDINIWNE